MATDSNANCSIPPCIDTNSSLANSSLAKMEISTGEALKLSLQILIALVGVVGNILVVVVMCRLGKKKQASDFCVQNLAVADLGILTLSFPFAVIKEKDHWPFGEFGCRYLYPVPEIFFGSSVWFIALIAIMRYRKLVTVAPISPSLNKIKRFLQEPKALSACVWITSFVIFCLPLYFVVEYHEHPNGAKLCDPDWSPMMAAFYICGLLTFFSYILPLLVISFTYLRISQFISGSSLFVKNLQQQQQQGTTEEAKATSARLKQNKNAKRILTPLVLVFTITMLPLTILRLAIVFSPAISKQTYYHNLIYSATVSTILNSSVNPVIYAVVSRNFRTGVSSLCIQRSRRRHSLSISGIILWIRSRSSSRGRSKNRFRPQVAAQDLDQRL